MAAISGRPLLEHTIELLKNHGITEIAINLHHHPERVMDYFGSGDRLGVRLHYSLEKVLQGTAGALNNFRGFFDDTFIVMYGDVLTNADLQAIIDFHREKKGMVTIGLYRVNNPTECGIVEMDHNGRIAKFVEKPEKHRVFSDLANAGIYVAEPDILDFIPEGMPSDFGKEIFPQLLSKGMPVYGFPVSEYVIDIGTVDKYDKANRDFIEGGFYKCSLQRPR